MAYEWIAAITNQTNDIEKNKEVKDDTKLLDKIGVLRNVLFPWHDVF